MRQVLRFGQPVGRILAFASDPVRTRKAAVDKFGKGVTVVEPKAATA
jgi:hypothetical protein